MAVKKNEGPSTTENNPIKNGAKNLRRHFSKEEVQTANRRVRSCAASVTIREMQIKTTRSYHLTPTGRTTILLKERKKNNKCGEGEEKMKHL